MRQANHSSPIIRAVTGAGKSILIAEMIAMTEGVVVLTTPTVKLVNQLAKTLKARGLQCGKYYTHAKQHKAKVIVCCNDSLPELARKIDPPELWIADEAHKTECDQVKNVLEDWVPARRIGFTATPYRADENERLSLFDALAYDYGPAQAIRDGVVVPPRVVHYQGSATELDAACAEMIAGASGPGIVDAKNITDAEDFAAYLEGQGIAAKTVHSKLKDATVQRRLRMLEDGELDCVVHVSLLSEGVDLPWLRWLCCRRPIGSRVLFAQYIGRGLRQFEDKRFCTVFDPHDLFGKLSLDYEAILAGGLEDDDDIPLMPALEIDFALSDVREAHTEVETLAGVPVRIIDPTVAYVRRVHLAMQCQGLIPMQISDTGWRRDEPTSRQLSKISKLSWVVNEHDVPPEHRRALIVAIKAAHVSDKGTASDLISILKSLQYGWPNVSEEAA
jgi:superfamily II DNA or RNA helicase